MQIGEKLSYGETGRQRGVSARHGIDIRRAFRFHCVFFGQNCEPCAHVNFRDKLTKIIVQQTKDYVVDL